VSRADRLRLAFAGLHPDRTRGLLDSYGSAGRVCRAIGAGTVDVPAYARQAAVAPVDALVEILGRVGVAAVYREDDEFPDHLAELPDSADLLFVRGTLPTTPMVAVVGTRRCSRYGRALAGSYGRAIAASGWPVVSGLARGIDGAAHRGVVDGGGVGVAVLGCGPDIIYPREHRQLHDDLIARGGAVVTEYPPGTPPHGWRFPPRNRIISGLSAAVVIVEAAETGGALVTATMALSHARVVMAVPGDIDRPTSKGCNLLICDGALPVLDPADLVEALSFVPGLPPPEAGPSGHVDPVMAAVGSTGSTLEELTIALALPIHEVAAAVTRLEIAGLVRWEGEVITVSR